MAGVGRRALERAFALRYGPGESLRGIQFDGMTDRRIVRMALGARGEPTEGPEATAAIDALLTPYVALLAEEVAETEGLGLHRGILAALDAAAAWPGVAI